MKVLLVEDDPGQQYLVKQRLESENIQVIVASSGQEALEKAWAETYDAMLLDYFLTDAVGLDVMGQIYQKIRPEELPAIILTGQGSEKIAVEAIKQGAFDYLIKEPDMGHLELLTLALKGAVERAQLIKDNRILWQKIVGENKELSRISQAKTEFVNTVAHEFRTPLTVIKGYTENLRDELEGAVLPQQKEVLTSMLGVITRLTALINSLLDIAKIESGMMTLKREKVNFSELFARVLEESCPLAERKNIHFRTNASSEIIEIWCDQEKIIQVLLNLLGNAFKFTPAGGEVEVSYTSYNAFLKIIVRDTGCGISEEFITKLFNQFQSIPSQGEGSGLGLWISYNIVKLHCGEIFVESKVSKGSTFTVILPLDLRKR